MANTNAPFGFSQTKGTGSAPTYEQNKYNILYSDTTKIYQGDAVIMQASGYITQATASTVIVAGIFVGCKYLSTSQKRTVWSNYWPGADCTTEVEAYVIDDPNAQFLVQGGAAALTQADVGSYIQLAVGSGSTATGLSGMYVNTPATTVTLPFIIRGLVTSPPGGPGTDAASAYNRVIVGFNNALTRTNGAGPTGL